MIPCVGCFAQFTKSGLKSPSQVSRRQAIEKQARIQESQASSSKSALRRSLTDLSPETAISIKVMVNYRMHRAMSLSSKHSRKH